MPMAMARRMVFVGLVAVILPVLVSGKPMGGKFDDISLEVSGQDVINSTCRSIALYNHSHMYARGRITGLDDMAVNLTVRVFKTACANVEISSADCEALGGLSFSGHTVEQVGSFHVTLDTPSGDSAKPFFITATDRTPTVSPPSDPTDDAAVNVSKASPNATQALPSSPSQASPSPTPTPPLSNVSKRSAVEVEPLYSNKQISVSGISLATRAEVAETSKNQGGSKGGQKMKGRPRHPPFYRTVSSGIFIVQVELIWLEPDQSTKRADDDGKVTVDLKLQLKNPYGFLSAIDYPALVFYGVMTAIYAIYSCIWMIAMMISYKDLIRLQFWIGAVLILGLLEKTFFVSEYSAINQGGDPSGLILAAETVSAAKRALARMLLIIVSLGFGTVKPRLGDSLGKVIAAGVIYFIFALIDGIVRAKQDTFYTQDTSSTVTLALLFIMDTIIFYWIFTSLVATRRALRLRKNYVKLSLYNHFVYTLLFAILAAICFLIWTFVELSFPKDGCLNDWEEVWLRDCFWHMLFVFILGIIMILWRPSSNRVRFAYSLVRDEEEEEEIEQGPNKNFETLKMRQVSKPSTPTPLASSQAEDDLRWVEENLPTTAVDKALPLILDSDEEVMTTRFEISKMN